MYTIVLLYYYRVVSGFRKHIIIIIFGDFKYKSNDVRPKNIRTQQCQDRKVWYEKSATDKNDFKYLIITNISRYGGKKHEIFSTDRVWMLKNNNMII